MSRGVTDSHITERFPGLDEAEARRRLADDGPNELSSERVSIGRRVAFEVLGEPMLLLLVGAATLYYVLGDLGEALVMSVAVVLVIGITLVQTGRTERALAALRDLTAPRARVLRGGKERRIPGRDVVRGDFLALAEGDRVPADGVLRWTLNLQTDESLLTGEAVPVRKSSALGEVETMPPGGDDLPFMYSGTLVVRGQGVLEVIHTGQGTAIGRIGKVMADVADRRTPLQRQVDRLVFIIGGMALVVCVSVVLGLGIGRGDWIGGLLAGIALAMTLLPEEIPVVLTVFLALGAWRLSKCRVLTRSPPALEALGSATVLCTDKTGTMTQNRMQVARLWVAGEHLEVPADGAESLPERFHEVVEFGILASQHDPFDPMEKAFWRLGRETLEGTEHLHRDWSLEREYSLSPELLAMSHVWSAPDRDRMVVAAKGAPEAIWDLCHLPEDTRGMLADVVGELAREGLRVLAVAHAYFDVPPLPGGQHDFDFELLGLVGLADPIRADVPAAIGACQRAGLKVLMITGDHADTAVAIARHSGLVGDTEQVVVVTGRQIESLASDAELADALKSTCIVARAVPEHKLRIVRALQGTGEIVAMTGDGVNDAPALKAAQIGIAMGERGTDVAREAADMVVVDDAFSSIVEAIAEGRRIQDKLRRALAFIVAVHVPIAGVALLPIVSGWPLLLLPVHVAFLELVIDPSSSIVFEVDPPDPGVMDRAPRAMGRELFAGRLLSWSVVQGLSVLVAVSAVVWWAHRGGRPIEAVRTLAFVTLLAGNLTLVLVNRSWSEPLWKTLVRPNLALWLVVLGALGFMTAALQVPSVSSLFGFTAVGASELLTASALGMGSLLWFEVSKLLRRA